MAAKESTALKKLREHRANAQSILAGVRAELKSTLEDAVELLIEIKEEGFGEILSHEDFAAIREKLGIGQPSSNASAKKKGSGKRRKKEQVESDRASILQIITSSGATTLDEIVSDFQKKHAKATKSAVLTDVNALLKDKKIQLNDGKYSVKK